jgi:Fe-S-cluster formation regulator IscX/YfhJ
MISVVIDEMDYRQVRFVQAHQQVDNFDEVSSTDP